MYLYFKCYPLFPPLPYPFPLLPWRCFHSHPPTPTSMPRHHPTPRRGAFTWPRTFPPIDAGQCHPLPHMWWSHGSLHVYSLVAGLVPGSSGEAWLVLPMVLQTPSAPSVFSLTPPLEAPCSDQWLAASILICISRALVEPLRRHPYQAPVSKHFLVSAIVAGFGAYIWDGSPGGAVSGWPFLQSTLHSLSLNKIYIGIKDNAAAAFFFFNLDARSLGLSHSSFSLCWASNPNNSHWMLISKRVTTRALLLWGKAPDRLTTLILSKPQFGSMISYYN